MRLGRRLSSMRITKPAKHSLRLRTVASMVSSQPAWMRAWALDRGRSERSRLLQPMHRELAVGPIELRVVLRC
ncbi:unnamed protein product [Ectocarpus sp. CCAP 1310/34]|nr:unnamed protein product [Ectocarpus sp. CCAP 1310/34]